MSLLRRVIVWPVSIFGARFDRFREIRNSVLELTFDTINNSTIDVGQRIGRIKTYGCVKFSNRLLVLATILEVVSVTQMVHKRRIIFAPHTA